MTLKTKIIILICVYAAGYTTALKLRPAPLEVSHNTEDAVKASKSTKKTFDPSTGKLLAEETSETIDALLKEKFKAKVPPPAPPADNLIITLNNKMHAGVLFNPSSLLPLLPSATWVGYAKDVRTGEDIYTLGYSKRLF